MRLETLRNDLETLIYRQREAVGRDLTDVTSDEERSQYSLVLEDAENWVYDNQDTFSEKDVRTKIASLKRSFALLEERKTGEALRAELVPQLRKALETAKKKGEKEEDPFKLELVAQIEQWLAEKEAEQGRGTDPVLLGADLREKIQLLSG